MSEVNNNNTQTEGNNEKTFTQEEVNKIVQERLARSKNKEPDELAKREAELNKQRNELDHKRAAKQCRTSAGTCKRYHCER